MSVFEDRTDAGRQLAKAVAGCAGHDPLVLAIPCGGVEVAHRVAERLECDMSLVIVRKLPFPDNPESGFGAIAEDGSVYFVDYFARQLPMNVVDRIISRQKREIRRRIRVLREGMPLPEIEGRTVIVVDDGIAMGSTMNAAVALCRNKSAARVVVAAPVAGPSAAASLSQAADQVVVLHEPPLFRAVAQAYANWHDVTDREVLAIMRARARQVTADNH